MTIIDRLCEERSNATFAEMREMVRQDLEDLLNTRQQGVNEIASCYPQLQHSLATYGLNNIDTVDMSCAEELETLLKNISDTIHLFEPRLENIIVINDSPTPGSNDYVSPFVLRLRIHADLRLGEYVDHIAFDTLIQKSGATVKEGVRDA